VTGTIVAGLIGLLIGMAVGASVLARWWIKRLRNPEVARDVLKMAYRTAHPHWLQRDKDDERQVCPCCGWTETEALGIQQEEKTS